MANPLLIAGNSINPETRMKAETAVVSAVEYFLINLISRSNK
ncbi:MAG TPA: hypothetical protein VFI73_04120 [Candidatus Nitrosopolaris sp.]|nr:hypothetical protein [Candidatus Nitrosopolaris sp.]